MLVEMAPVLYVVAEVHGLAEGHAELGVEEHGCICVREEEEEEGMVVA